MDGAPEERELALDVLRRWKAEIRPELWPSVRAIEFDREATIPRTTRTGASYRIILPSGLEPSVTEIMLRHELCHALDQQSPVSSSERLGWPALSDIPVFEDTDEQRRAELFAYLCELGADGVQRVEATGSDCLSDGVTDAASDLLDEYFRPEVVVEWEMVQSAVGRALWDFDGYWPEAIEPVWEDETSVFVGTSQHGTAVALNVVDGTWDHSPYYGGVRSSAEIVEFGVEPSVFNVWVRDLYDVEGTSVEAWHIEMVWGETFGTLAFPHDPASILPACTNGIPDVVANASRIVGVSVSRDGATWVRHEMTR